MIHQAIVIGSGAAGLAAAVRLCDEGVKDVVLITENLYGGTSYNTGSDKQTYYKLGLYGLEPDSPELLAKTYFDGGSMHGDLALVESSLSSRCFYHLVNGGVPFPHDAYGQFIGYKTDHDPLRRATSCGPYTSKEMCTALIRMVKSRPIVIRENAYVASLLVENSRCMGCLVVENGKFVPVAAENTVFAAGGPGGLYATSVYPAIHTGSIGLALEKGAMARNLPESQYGLASIGFRWNVSGTYMQVLPRFVSTAADGSGEREFLREHFADSGKMNSMIFLKGYQWPFDVRKVPEGSSIIDMLVYRETVERGRRVWLDFRSNCADFSFENLSPEAREYLEKSAALFGNPLARLEKMNPGAIELYRDHRIDLASEMLEIAVCAQHNNGGLAGDLHYESVNLRGLFPIGEINGSHGVYRPGGSALNAGQVGAFQAAEFIAKCRAEITLEEAEVKQTAEREISRLSKVGSRDVSADRRELQQRMTRAGAYLRNIETVRKEALAAKSLYEAIVHDGYPAEKLIPGLCNRQLAYAHYIYLRAIEFQIAAGVGSRGSALVLDAAGKIVPENPEFRKFTLETVGENSRFVPVREIPHTDGWFENIWRDYREKRIFE